MGLPITVKGQGICFAFPDVCLTPAPPGPPVPIPYPNTLKSQLADASREAASVFAGGNPVITSKSSIPITTGDEGRLRRWPPQA